LKDGSTCFVASKFVQVFTRLAPRKILISGFGYNDGAVVRHVIGELEKELGGGNTVTIFVNLLEESGNSASTREAWATWAREHRSAIESTHILFRSRLMEMAISIVAMLVGGGTIKAYSNLREFEQSVQSRVPGLRSLPVFRDLPQS
jgi:hypothetical protein